MRTVTINTLYSYEHTKPVPFSIVLTDCKTNVFNSATVTFSGIEDGELPGKLAINNGTNDAAIALFDSKRAPINLNQATDATDIQSGTTTLKFTAYVQGLPSAIKNRTITEGEFSSVVNFVRTYQQKNFVGYVSLCKRKVQTGYSGY